MRWACDTSNITWRSKSSNDAWKCLKSALDLSDSPVMHSRLPPKTSDSQTFSDGTVERSVSVEQQIADTDVQWPPTPTWGGLSRTVERSHVANGMPVLPTCSAPGRRRGASAALHSYSVLSMLSCVIKSNQIKSFNSDNTVHKKKKREDTERQTVVQINTQYAIKR